MKLILEGKSLNKISKTTGLSKTTIYYHMRKKLGRKYYLIKLREDNFEVIGEVIGFFAGDGGLFFDPKRGQWQVRFYFNKKEIKVIAHYLDSLKKLTGKTPFTYYNESITVLCYNSKVLSNFFKTYLEWENKKGTTVRLKNKNLLKNKRFLIGFLRGLTDSDGYVRKERKEIYFGSVSGRLSKDFVKGLDFLGLKSKVYIQKRTNHLDFNKVRLSGLEVDRFISIIRPIKALENAPTRN